MCSKGFNRIDVTNMMNIIDVCTQRGAFQASELSGVGQLYDKLKSLISECNNCPQNKCDDCPNKQKEVEEIEEVVDQVVEKVEEEKVEEPVEVLPPAPTSFSALGNFIEPVVEEKVEEVVEKGGVCCTGDVCELNVSCSSTKSDLV